MIGSLARRAQPALYIHIPFCTVKCSYCDFFSLPLPGESVLNEVFSAEIRHLSFLLHKIERRDFRSLYIGGGTPSAVPRSLLEKFLCDIHKLLPELPSEATIEANPETVDEEFLRIAADKGITRLSMGIQSFNDQTLRSAGRQATAAANRKALALVSRLWKGSVNLDLLFGFHGQDAGSALQDLEELLSWDSGHISLYALTPEENTPLGENIKAGRVPDINEDIQETIRVLLDHTLIEKGYANYEISNYAKPGEECLHNLGYWELRPYLGIGPGAVSTLPSLQTNALRLTAVRNIGSYAAEAFTASACGIPSVLEAEDLSPRDFLLDFLLMGFRTRKGIDLDRFERIFHFSFPVFFDGTLQKYSQRVEFHKGRIALNEEGLCFLNGFLLDLLLEIDKKGYEGPYTWPEEELKPPEGGSSRPRN